ncbi:hypothetical protein KMZ27_16740 [Pseudomonas shirazica]|nr:hypothetical protein [Pseudomonas shirazica]
MLAPLFALCAWVTLNPYFLWNSLRHMAIAGMLSGCLAIGAFLLGDRPRRREVPGFILICLFVLYISMLPKLDGSTTRWYFVLPTIFALAVFSDQRRGKVLQWFAWFFAVSLIPGIVVSLCKIAGLTVHMDRLPLLNPAMAEAGVSTCTRRGASSVRQPRDATLGWRTLPAVRHVRRARHGRHSFGIPAGG